MTPAGPCDPRTPRSVAGHIFPRCRTSSPPLYSDSACPSMHTPEQRAPCRRRAGASVVQGRMGCRDRIGKCMESINFSAIFAAAPDPYLLLAADSDFTILAANDA